MSKKNDLESNKSDLLASASRSTIGIIPFAGPLLGELITSIIPNQRVDRLTKYIQELEKRISSLEAEKLENAKIDEETIDLIEEGFVQASRIITKERREYIASIVANGISREGIEAAESKMLLKILAELNDVEIIWLRSYKYTSIEADKLFNETHKEILKPIHPFINNHPETQKQAAIQENYTLHLERLGLIKDNVRINRDTKMPEFDSMSGKPKVFSRNTTTMGKLLLEQIGIID